MLDKDRIDLFYKDLERLGLRFPVAEIHRRTGLNKGSISEYLNRKREPSQGFIDAFYREFKDELNKNSIVMTTVTAKPKFGDEKPKPNDDKLVNVVVSQQDTIKMLTEALTKLIAKS